MKANWPKVNLGELMQRSEEIIDLLPDVGYREVTVRLWGNGIVERRRVLGNEISGSRRFVARTRQFIVSRIDARNGAMGIVPQELDGAVVTNDFPLFKIRETRLLPEFLGWLSRTRDFVELCQKASEGTTNRVRLKEERFLTLEIPLPPLAEQQRIVARIEELAAQINEARILHQQAADEARVLLHSKVFHFFSSRLNNDQIFEKLGNYVLDACYGTSEKTTNDETGIPILRMGNIQDGQLDLRDLKYLHLSEKDESKLLLQHGDILVNRTNSADLVGKCAVYDLEGNYSFASYLIRLRLDLKRADPWLVSAYVNSPLGRAYMVAEKRQMTGQANVNATKLKELPISLPSMTEQRLIVKELDVLQAEIKRSKPLQVETFAELDALLPSLLDKAFKGGL